MRNLAIKIVLKLVLSLAVAVFAGIAIYGIIIYWGGEISKKVPHAESLTMGLIAVVCVVVMVIAGGALDRIAHREQVTDSGAPEDRET